MRDALTCQRGLEPHHFDTAAHLYEQAFGAKFAAAVPDAGQRIELLRASLRGEFAFTALLDGKLVGLAGIQTPDGSLTGGIDARGLLRQLGLLGGLRACVVFALYERKPQPGELVMDGISVDASCRGRGIGSTLLGCVRDYASRGGFNRIRLDVIDANAAAKRLYEREGFTATKTEHFETLRPLLGFGGVTTMHLHVAQHAARGTA